MWLHSQKPRRGPLWMRPLLVMLQACRQLKADLGGCAGRGSERRRRRGIGANFPSASGEGFKLGAWANTEFFGMQKLVAAQAVAGLVDGCAAGGIPQPQGVVC